MLRRVVAFCRLQRPVLLLVSFPRSQSPVPLPKWCLAVKRSPVHAPQWPASGGGGGCPRPPQRADRQARTPPRAHLSHIACRHPRRGPRRNRSGTPAPCPPCVMDTHNRRNTAGKWRPPVHCTPRKGRLRRTLRYSGMQLRGGECLAGDRCSLSAPQNCPVAFSVAERSEN